MESSQFDFTTFQRHFSKSPEKAFRFIFDKENVGALTFDDFMRLTRKKFTVERIMGGWIESNEPSMRFATFLRTAYLEQFRLIIKEKRLFQSPHFYPSIKECFADEESFLNELEFWRNLWAEMESEIRKSRTILAKYNFEEVMILCGLYYDKLRITAAIQKNHDASLIETITLILNEKLDSYHKLKRRVKSNFSPETFRNRSIELLDQLIQTGDSEIENLFHVFDKKAELQFLYEYYCYHEFQLNFRNENNAVLKPKDEIRYLRYKKAGERYSVWQGYYHNLNFYEGEKLTERIEASGMSWYNKLAHYRAWEQFDQFTDAGFSELITTGEKGDIDALTCFLAMNSISSWSNIRWNNFIETEILQGFAGNAYKLILGLMAHNLQEFGNDAMPVFYRNYQELMRTAEEIHHFEPNEAERAYSLFTTNLNLQETEPLDFSKKPFIKIGPNVYWIAGIMANKNYAVMLHDILIAQDKKMAEEGPRNTYASRVEKLLTGWFEKNDFVSKPNYDCYVDEEKKNKLGEIDLLAFKNNTLFVCQVKSTFHRATIAEIYQHFTDERSGIAKAITQLTRDIGYIKENWEKVRADLGVDCPMDKLKIVPLAITTTLEPGDGAFQISDVTGYVIPLFELRVILTNSKFFLINLSELALKNQFGENIPVEYMRALMGIKDSQEAEKMISEIVLDYAQREKPQFNLWAEGHQLCEPEDLLNAIEKQTVWDMISEEQKLNTRTIALGEYLLNYLR